MLSLDKIKGRSIVFDKIEDILPYMDTTKTLSVKPGDKIHHCTILGYDINSYNYSDVTKTTYVWIRCDCGNYKTVNLGSLKTGSTTSCGCQMIKNVKERCTVYNDDDRKLYKIADGILSRCTNNHNVGFYNYGGRGIKCMLGSTIRDILYNLKIIPGYFDGAQIDRIDNDSDYTLDHPIYGRNVWYDVDGHKCVGNLRWVSRDENNKNRLISQRLSMHDIASRLMGYGTFINIILTNKLDIREFTVIYFKEITTTYDGLLCLYIHKSLDDKLLLYVDRIIENFKNAKFGYEYRFDINQDIYIFSKEELENIIHRISLTSKYLNYHYTKIYQLSEKHYRGGKASWGLIHNYHPLYTMNELLAQKGYLSDITLKKLKRKSEQNK